eukprot:5030869-Alexandrium_andersonii.AAC.1
MSASLVGSEMCIRDRRPARGRHTKKSRPERRFGGASKGWHGGPQQRGSACLLYTSDAADDM